MYRRTHVHRRIPGGFLSFEDAGAKTRVYGFGYGDHIQMRDQQGNVWRGSAEQGPDETVRYRFHGPAGLVITGMSDSWGMTLRDDRGRIWRGFFE